jgi:hypothetical protein
VRLIGVFSVDSTRFWHENGLFHAFFTAFKNFSAGAFSESVGAFCVNNGAHGLGNGIRRVADVLRGGDKSNRRLGNSKQTTVFDSCGSAKLK